MVGRLENYVTLLILFWILVKLTFRLYTRQSWYPCV
jgi:hypothetical protein